MRFIAGLVLSLSLLSPALVLADDATPTPTPTTDPSSLLGPQSAGVSSTADGSALQPAGQNPLQSTNNDSNGLTAGSSNLQAPTTNGSDLKVLLGNDADGTQHDVSDPGTASHVGRDLLILAIVAVILGGGYWLLSRGIDTVDDETDRDVPIDEEPTTPVEAEAEPSDDKA